MRYFRYIACVILVSFLPIISHAADIYFAQAAQGSGDGTSCANAYAYNDPTHGINGSQTASWVAGNTLHLCGTITVSAGANGITVNGSGASGTPITIVFEPNAILQSPQFGVAVYLDGQNYITIDGGTDGIIQNTANGSGLTYQSGTKAFYFNQYGANNITIKNLTIANLYVHSSFSDATVDATTVNCVSAYGSNISIYNNTMHDMGWCLTPFLHAGNSNIDIYNNNIYNVDHGIAVTSGGTSSNPVGPVLIHDNYIHDFANWDATGNPYHHDGIHCFGGGNSHWSGLYFYNNLFSNSSTTSGFTGLIFIEGPNAGTPCSDATSPIYIFNDVFIANSNIQNAFLVSGSGNEFVANNTFQDNNPNDVTSGGGDCWEGQGTVTFKNNAIQNCYTDAWMQTGPSSPSPTFDYNSYGNSQALTYTSGYNPATAFPGWRGNIGGDAHSAYYSSLGLTSLGAPNAGAKTIGSGTNLSSLCTGYLFPLCSTTSAGNTVTPVARPTTGAWDTGAYQYSSNVITAPAPPTGLAATVQ